MYQALQQSFDVAFGGQPTFVWWSLGGGVLVALCAFVAAWLVMRRARSIETLVAQRTAELAQINEKLAEEICDHLNTEHALDKERESLRAVLNNLHESILVLDTSGHLRIANGAARRLFRQINGIELERLDGSAAEFFALGDTLLPGDALPHARALRGENVRDYDLSVRTAAAGVLTLRINGQPLYTSDGRQHGAVIVVRDITESKKIERLKSEFVATVSHELRTPITSIRGSLGLVAAGASGQLSDKTQRLVEIALRNSNRLALLINDLLDIEKAESGKMRFDLERNSLLALVEQAIEANSSYAESFGVRYVLAATDVDADVFVDAHRLLQVMANLLSNAAKFSPRDVAVEVSVLNRADKIRVSVRDHGPGIPPEFRDRIFEKFSQADSSDARSRSGTGLGLAICKAIVEQLGGKIGFDSEVGVGTTFYFELSAVVVDETRDTRRETRPEPEVTRR